MSKLAKKLATMPAVPNAAKGPRAACHIYGPGDLEDFQAVQARRKTGETWRAVQSAVDEASDITQPIKPDPFRYHWSGKCAHWDGVDLP